MRVRVLVVVGTLLGTAACSSSTSSSSAARPKRTTTTIARGSTAKSGTSGWSFYGHDYANSRRNPAEKQITAATVAGLRTSWSIDGVVGVTGTPAVVDGIAYFDDWAGNVRAVDAATGKARWLTKLGAGMF